MKHRLLPVMGLVALFASCDSPTAREEVPPDDPRLEAAQRVVDVAGGFSSTCALTEAGRTFCWGENRFGEFGDGTRTPSGTPVPAAGGLTFAAISGTRGTSRLCGITATGDGYCWGYNINGELGDGTSTDRWEPARITGGLKFRDIVTSYHTCGLAVDGRAFCWGSPLGGALGYEDLGGTREVSGGLRFASITVGMRFSCGLTSAGKAYCWGWGSMLGNGSEQQRNTPTAVAGGHTFAAISAGEEHACGLTAAGEAWCWGRTEPPFGRVRLVPERVPHGGRPLRQIAAGGTYTCALDDQGRAYCWIGGATMRVPTSVRFAGLDGGKEGACAYTAGGALYCWQIGFTASTPSPITRVPAFPQG